MKQEEASSITVSRRTTLATDQRNAALRMLHEMSWIQISFDILTNGFCPQQVFTRGQIFRNAECKVIAVDLRLRLASASTRFVEQDVLTRPRLVAHHRGSAASKPAS